MSEDGFHVHGPHDHALEHATGEVAHGDNGHGDHTTSRIAMVTAIIATIGAIFSYMGGATQADAGLFKNNAALAKADASNQWNYYQAKSTKQSLAEFAKDFAPPDKKDKYNEKIERYIKEKTEIQKNAEKHESVSKEWDKQSEEQMHEHHRWAQATTVLQVAIALAAIALLTKRQWLERTMYGVAGIGILIGIVAFFHL